MFLQAAAEGLTEEQKKRIVFGECYSALLPPCHAVLVLGGGVDEMQSRAASAAALCSRIPVGKVIASGGAVREFGGAPKAECMILHGFLHEAGVTTEIIEEHDSKDTIENILYAFTLLKNDLLSEKHLTVAVVTSPWHLRRAVGLAECLMPRTVSVYGYHALYDAQRLAWERSPERKACAENELRLIREAVECGFIDDFEI